MTVIDLPAFSLKSEILVCPITKAAGGGTSGRTDIWFPVPPTMVDLPTAPTPTPGAGLVPANSTVVDQCFDPENISTDQIFNDLLPQTETAPVFESTLDTDKLLLPKNVRVPIRAKLRAVFAILKANYDLTPRLTEFESAVRLAQVTYRLGANVVGESAAYTLTGLPAGRTDVFFAGKGTFAYVGQISDFIYTSTPSKSLNAGAGQYVVNDRVVALVLSSFDTDILDDIDNVDWYWTVNRKPDISGISKFGAGSADYNQNNMFMSFVLDDAVAPAPGADFTIECWHNAGLGYAPTVIRGIFSLTNSDIDYFEYVYYVRYNNGVITLAELDPATYIDLRSYTHPVTVPNSSWVHLALEYTEGALRLYVNGVPGDITFVPDYQIDLQNRVFLGHAGMLYRTQHPGYGLFDDFRLTARAIYKGKSFTPPTEAFKPVTINGGNVTFAYFRPAQFDAGVFTFTGYNTALAVLSAIRADATSYTLTGGDISFNRASRVLLADSGTFTLTGKATFDYPTYLGSTSRSTTTNTLTIPWYGSAQAGDLGILVVETSAGFNNLDWGPMPKPAKWNSIPNLPIRNTGITTSGSCLTAYWRVLESTPTTDEYLGITANHAMAALYVFRGPFGPNPIVSVTVSEDSVAGTSVTWPQHTVVGYRNLLLDIASFDYDSSSLLFYNYNPNSADKVSVGNNGISTTSGDGGGLYFNALRVSQPGLLPSSTGDTGSQIMQHCYACIEIGTTYTPLVVLNLLANAGAFAFSGQSSVLRKSGILAAATGAYAVTGSEVYLGAPPIVFPAAGVAYTLTGQAAGVGYNRGITAAGGGFTAAGQEALLGEPDAVAYIAAVQVADSQALEPEVANAYSKFIWGCKSDGIWAAIKASCIMAGARTLAGALTPLVGTAPTNNNFVAGDYNRKTGLAGDGSTKYLNSNRANNADPQNNNHNAVYISNAATTTTHIIGSSAVSTAGGNSIFSAFTGSGSTSGCWSRSDGTTVTLIGTPSVALVDFVGTSRNSSTAFSSRVSGGTSSASVTSSAPTTDNVLVFGRGTPAASLSNARLSFYSIGESLDLALLDSRVTTLMADIAAAIP